MEEKRDRASRTASADKPGRNVDAAIRLAARRTRPKKARPAGNRRLGWSLLFAVAVLLLAATYWLLKSEIPDSFSSTSSEMTADSLVPLAACTLYLPDASGGLRPAARYIGRGEDLESDVRAVVDLLAAAGGSGGLVVDPWPDQVTVLDVYVSGEGLAYLNFASSLRWRLPAGDLAEWMVVASLTQSLCGSFPDIRGVRVMIDGESSGVLRRVMPLERTYRPEQFGDEVGATPRMKTAG